MSSNIANILAGIGQLPGTSTGNSNLLPTAQQLKPSPGAQNPLAVTPPKVQMPVAHVNPIMAAAKLQAAAHALNPQQPSRMDESLHGLLQGALGGSRPTNFTQLANNDANSGGQEQASSDNSDEQTQ